jgi:hypothetical protein
MVNSSRGGAKKCPSGTIMRKGYKRKSYRRKSGSKVKSTRVSSKCIKAIGSSAKTGKKRSSRDAAYLKRRASIQKKLSEKYGTPKCPKGEIARAGFTKEPYERKSYRRSSYTRADGTEVKGALVRSASIGKSEYAPVCVEDTGKPGKGKKIPVHLAKGELKKHGYEDVDELTVAQRHTALRKAEKEFGAIPLFRKLIILGTMFRNKDPELSQKYRDDAYWVEKEFKVRRASSKKSSKKNSKKRSRKGSHRR